MPLQVTIECVQHRGQTAACCHDTRMGYSDQFACCVQVAFCQAMLAGTVQTNTLCPAFTVRNPRQVSSKIYI